MLLGTSIAAWFSNLFDSNKTANDSVDRMRNTTSGRGYSIMKAITAPLRATAAAVSAVLSIPENVLGAFADNAIGAQRIVTEVPTGAVFEAARRFNSQVSPRVYYAPSGIIGWVRSKLNNLAKWGDNDFSGAT